MRVAHVVQSLAIGGQEMLIVQLTRELASRGHLVRVISLTPGGALAPELRALAGVEVLELGRREGLDPRLFAAMLRAFAEFRPDVVHTHNASPLIYATPVARLLGARVVHTKHGVGSISPRTRWLVRRASPWAFAYVCVSDETARLAVRDEGAPAARVTVVRNGIPLALYADAAERRSRARATLGLAPEAPVVGTVARLVPEKDHALLVDAVARLDDPHTCLVLAGDGPERAALERRGRERLGPRLHLLGARRDVADVLAAFDVFALSSRTEGVPLALLEAMASGLPVVATAVGGVPGVVPTGAGALVPHGDAAALARALAVRLADADRRAREGALGRETVAARYSLAAMTDTYQSLYRGERRGSGYEPA